MKPSIKRLAGASLILALAPALPAASQALGSFDANAPVYIHADNQHSTTAQCVVELTGNAQVTQGTTRIVGSKLTTRQTKKGSSCGEVNRVEVDKDVFYVTPDGTVRADHAVYDVAASTAVFTGQVIVVRGDNVAIGSKLTVNTKTNDTTMEGPVRALIIPPAKAAPAKPPA